MARDVEAIVARLGSENDGIVAGPALDREKVTAEELRPLRRRGVLVLIAEGVYRLRDHPWTWRCRLRAALALAGAGAVVCRRSAARLHGFYAYRESDEIEVIVSRGRHPRAATVGRCVQTRRLPSAHVTMVDGFPVTTVARTFFDLCGDPDHGMPVAHPVHEQRMARVYNDALARRGLRFVHEVVVLIALARRGRNGTQLVRQLLERFGPTYEPDQSESESLFSELLALTDLPVPRKQVTMSDAQGFIGVVDFVWSDAWLVVEIDSTWHDGPLERGSDLRRDDRLRALGYQVRRYRHRDLVLRWSEVLRELVTDLGPCGPRSVTDSGG